MECVQEKPSEQKEMPMAVPVRRQAGTLLPDLVDWAESFPSLLGLRTLPGLQGIRVEDYVDDNKYVVRAELPGIDPEKDVTVTVDNHRLTIIAERSEEVVDKRHSEFRYGSFTRTVPLPPEAKEDGVKAKYADGILTVTIALGDAKKSHKKISIER